MFKLEFQGKITKNDVTKLIDCKYNLQQFIRDPDIKAIQIMIETIASTFSCDVPTELGLKKYVELLSKYLPDLYPLVTNHLCETFRYPRLPLPVEFVEYLEPLDIAHKKYYQYVVKIEQMCNRLLENNRTEE